MTSTPDIVFWGASGQAKVLRECLGKSVNLIALVDNADEIHSPFDDVPLVGGRNEFDSWLTERNSIAPLFFLVAIGGSRGRERCELQADLVRMGLLPYRAIHATAFVAQDACIGSGCQILAQAAVCVDTQLGDACIVNTAATVDHECRLGHGVHICPGAHLAGCVEVGDYVTVGTGAVVLPRVRIGTGAIVGAGAVVTRNVSAGETVVGAPARSRP